MKLVQAKTEDFEDIEAFLLPHEQTCVQLAAAVRKKSPGIFVLRKDGTDGRDGICGVIQFEKTVLHCVPQFREEFRAPLEAFFAGKPVHSIIGSRDFTEHLKQILAGLGFCERQSNFYRLMTLAGVPKPAPESLSSGDELRRCSAQDFDALFDLQKKYLMKEVAPAAKPVSDLECTASLHQILKNQLVLAVFSDGDAVAKANTNAIGLNWAQIGGVYTHPLFRRNHYAWQLVHALCTKALGGEKNCCLFVKEQNKPAQELYRRIGFADAGNFEITYY